MTPFLLLIKVNHVYESTLVKTEGSSIEKYQHIT
jgi:hypothetical protein